MNDYSKYFNVIRLTIMKRQHSALPFVSFIIKMSHFRQGTAEGNKIETKRSNFLFQI